MELTASEAARRLGVSKDWVSRMCRAGELAGARKVGPVWVIPEEVLEGVTPPGPGRPRKADTRKTDMRKADLGKQEGENANE